MLRVSSACHPLRSGADWRAGSWMFRSDASTSSDQSQSLQQSAYRSKASLPSATPVTLPNGSSRTLEKLEGESLCDTINDEDDLYKILGTPKKSSVDTIRRQFLSRSRMIHPESVSVCISHASAHRLIRITTCSANYRTTLLRLQLSNDSRLRMKHSRNRLPDDFTISAEGEATMQVSPYSYVSLQ